METIKIKYFDSEMEKLTYIEGKSDWIDLRASETVELKQGEFRLIALGVAMELPDGMKPMWRPEAPPLRITESFRRTVWALLTEVTVEIRICGGCRYMPPGIR